MKKLQKTSFPYKVKIDRHCVAEERSEEKYGSWSEEYLNSFVGVSKAEKFPDVNSPVDVAGGSTGFLVWVEYGYGDSFGYATFGQVEAVGILPTLEMAEALQKALEKSRHYPDEDRYSFTHESKDGQIFHYKHAPWAGYFNKLERVHIEKISKLSKP